MRRRIRPLLVALAALLALSSLAYGAERRQRPARGADRLRDVRAGERASVGPATRSAQRRLLGRLGRGGVIRLAPATGTPRFVTDLGGGLTRRSHASPTTIAGRFLRDQRRAFGLDAAEAESLRVDNAYRSQEGVDYVRLRQTYRGVPAFDGVVTAAVAKGRLLSLAGAPQPGLEVPSIRPRLGADRAQQIAQRDAGVSRGARHPRLVLFDAPGGPRLAWSMLVFADAQRIFSTVVDAGSGEVLRRANLLKRATTGKALDYQPGAASGGTPDDKDFSTYIDSGNDRLRGAFAYTYADPTGADDNANSPLGNAGTQIPPSSDPGTETAKWDYTAVTEGADAADPTRRCPTTGCTWNGPSIIAPASVFTADNNWQRNLNQVATQVHYFVNRFHDHLKASPISFDAASGNFENGDRVHAQVDDAVTDVPPTFNNASMFTPPDDSPPIMEMYLFTNNDLSGANDVNGGDDAQVVLHEYTHGLSNRLVCCDANGLNSDQSGAMGEAWSDWYMFDYLEEKGFQPDTSTPGELVQGGYENVDFVSKPTDCPVSSSCGGYTYGDFGHILGSGPEVHADGEIWTQTLWDLRTRLIAVHGRADGIARARRLITGGMRRSPSEPDFLDMRDAILATDSQLQGGGDQALIREVFAARGMGSCASSSSGFDTTPTQSLSNSCSSSGPSGSGGGSAGGSGSGTGTTAGSARLTDIAFGGFPGRRTSLRRVLRRGLAGRISCDADCGFRASLVLPRRSARKARFRGRTVVVARASSSDAAGGSGRRIRFRFSRRTARKLRRLTRGTAIEVRVTATDSRGTRRTEKKKLRLRR